MAFILGILFLIFSAIACSAAGPDCKADMPPEIAKFTECCPIVTTAEQADLDDKFKVCQNITDDCLSAKCLAKQYNIGFNETSNIDKEMYKKFIMSKKTGDIASLFTTGIDDCFDNPAGNPCKTSGVMDCLVNRVVQNCPKIDTLWNPTKNKDCDIIKGFLAKCQIS